MPLILVILAACSGASGPAASTGGAGGGSPTGSVATPGPSAGSATGSGAAGGGGGTGGSVAAGDDLCGLLGPADFAAVGISGTGTATENNQDNSNVYCVYAGKSAATGGVEFDAFLAASKSDSEATFNSIEAPMLDFEGVGKAAFPDADGAKLRTDIPDGYAGIAIWKGKLAFDIGVPTSDQAKDQLIALAKLVLQRSAGLTD
jgi:hypothetical protein